jgi:hypothetical protein
MLSNVMERWHGRAILLVPIVLSALGSIVINCFVVGERTKDAMNDSRRFLLSECTVPSPDDHHTPCVLGLTQTPYFTLIAHTPQPRRV